MFVKNWLKAMTATQSHSLSMMHLVVDAPLSEKQNSFLNLPISEFNPYISPPITLSASLFHCVNSRIPCNVLPYSIS